MGKKIIYIYPSSYNYQNRLIKAHRSFVPSRALPYLAALTPERFEAHLIDELIDDVDFDMEADLVAMSGMLRHMPRAVDIAREFKKRGVPSIIGGVGAFSVRDYIEESGVFASLVLGEVDREWGAILDDFDRGCLKKQYTCAPPQDLSGFPPPRFDLLNKRKYIRSFVRHSDILLPVETSRGCPHDCSFCLVTRYFGKKMRYRPIGDVVDEIKHHGVKFILFTDDNIAINPTRARELFRALKPLKIEWFGQFESRVAADHRLLRLAEESGCRNALVGIESIVADNLRSVNKERSAGLSFKEIADGFEKAGIDLFASMIFGMENDTPEIIDQTVKAAIDAHIDVLMPWMLTPIPATPCYDEYKREGRLAHEDYSRYDFWHAVISPKRMTADDLEKSYWRGLRRFYGLPSIISRAIRGRQWRLSWMLCSLYFHRQVSMGLHPIAGNS